MQFYVFLLSVAHIETYGFGFMPYEFLPPPGDDLVNGTISEARAHELRLGMFSLRSYILPKLLSVILQISEWTGITASPFLVRILQTFFEREMLSKLLMNRSVIKLSKHFTRN